MVVALTFNAHARRLGILAAAATVILGVAYAVTLAAPTPEGLRRSSSLERSLAISAILIPIATTIIAGLYLQHQHGEMPACG